MQAVGFNSDSVTDNSFSIANEAGNYYYTILDSGSPHIVVPKTMYGAIIDKLMKASDDPQYYTKEGITFVDCYMVGTFANLEFMINDHFITVTPYEYIWDVNGDAETCILMITEHDYDFFVLGMPIYLGFYTHHSVTDSTIQFTPLRGLTKPPLRYAPVPPEYLFPRPEREDTCTILCLERSIIKGFFKSLWWGVQQPPKIIGFLLKVLWQILIFALEFTVFVIKLPFYLVYYFFYGIYYIFVIHKW